MQNLWRRQTQELKSSSERPVKITVLLGLPSSWTLFPPRRSQRRNTSMVSTWILLFFLISGGRTFMIHSSQLSLCLEEAAHTGEVLLQRCSLDSESQQWLWIGPGMLMSAATSRCLSAQHGEPVRTQPCGEPDVDPAGLMWDCDGDRLVSRDTAEQLSVSNQRLTLTKFSKHSKWRSVDQGDICQDRLRLRRASDDLDQFEDEEPAGELPGMTKEQREYLRWFYRTEDPTTWKFVMLGIAFVCLLVGFLLLGMGAVANKSRKKIAKYKAAASLIQSSEGQELQVVSPIRDNGASSPSPLRSPVSSMETSELKAGNIVVTWKDGNTSCLYADPAEEEERHQEDEEVKHEEASAPEQQEVVTVTDE